MGYAPNNFQLDVTAFGPRQTTLSEALETILPTL